MNTDTKKMLVETVKEAVLEIVVLVANKVSESASAALKKEPAIFDESSSSRPAPEASGR